MSRLARRRRPLWFVGGLLLTAVLLVLWSARAAKAVAAQAKAKIDAVLEHEGLIAELPETVDWNWRGVVTLGPVALANRTRPEESIAHVRRVVVTPRWGALLRGRLLLERVRLEDVDVVLPHALHVLRDRLADEDGQNARASATARGSSAERVGRLEWEGLVLSYVRGGRTLHTEPLSGSLVPVDGLQGRGLEGELALESGGRLTFRAEQEGRAAALAFDVDRMRLLPPWLLVALGQPSELIAGTVEGSGTVKQDARGNVQADVALSAKDLWVNDARFGPKMGPWAVSIKGPAQWNAASKTAELSWVVGLGEEAVPLHVKGNAALVGQQAFKLEVELPRVDFGRLVHALPAAVAPPAPIYGVRGELGLRAEVKGPLFRKDQWELNAKFDLEPLRAELRAAPKLGLMGDFRHIVRQGSGKGRALQVGRSNPRFTALEDVPKPLISALLLSEDSGFFAHQGFDLRALARHLWRPETDKGVLRGGSTVSQQLAKNLYLSPERTYARKVREALSTLVIEASAPKQRLLEIYLNIIEWGPGLYGIGEAAAHYFGKAPEALNLKESIFLATIVPSPVKYHGYCSRGAVTPVWEQRMRDLLFKMYDAGVISQDEHDGADQTTLEFAHAPLAIDRDDEL